MNHRILIAPNAFKNSLSATEAGLAIQSGLQKSKLACITECFPIGDGGDGTGWLLVNRLGGYFLEALASDPLGRKIKTSVGFIDQGNTAVIEMSDISGLKLLKADEKNPLHASSYGCGELIRLALDKKVDKIILAIGGSSTVDGGCGILKALGARFLDGTKKELEPVPQNLSNLASIDLGGLDKRIFETDLIILCDVNNFLLGEQGAAFVFGPQKGASAKEVILLEKAMQQFRNIVLRQMGEDMNSVRYGGAAGGVAAGLKVLLNAQLLSGIEYFLDLTGFDEALKKTTLLITGEGSIDLQTLEGKAPFGAAVRAKKKNIPVIGLGGQVPLESIPALNSCFDVLLAIGNGPEDLKTAMQHTAESLQFISEKIGQLLSLGSG